MPRAALEMLCMIMLSGGRAVAQTVLFVGNSFTFSAGSAVWKYHTDLNGKRVGGVLALPKLVTPTRIELVFSP